MSGFGVVESLISAILIYGVISALISLRKGRGVAGAALVLRKFEIDESQSSKQFVEIVGRTSGILGWILTVLRLNPETTLRVTKRSIYLKNFSLFGETYQIIPLPSVSSAHCGYSRPIGLIIIGAFWIISGLIVGMNQRNGLPVIVTGLVIGVIFFIIYGLCKKIFISFETGGGLVAGVSFRRSIIGNVSVDINKALKAIFIINQNVIQSQIK